jgi:hypothetical protein
MKSKDLFEAAVRILGLILVLISLVQIVSLIFVISSPAKYGLDGPNRDAGMPYTWLLFLLLGIFFLRGGQFVTRLAYGPEKPNDSN